MKRILICVALTMALAAPAFAQQGPYGDKQNPYTYTDTEDGQPLKIFSYFLAPIGYALEWTVTRPLHYLATRTPLTPMMSGDTEYSQIYYPGDTVNPNPPTPPALAYENSAVPATHIAPAPSRPPALRPLPSMSTTNQLPTPPPGLAGQPVMH
ncbi:MAG TPA: hypothetical protein VNF45_03655 [Candidatus Binataceae bacterium]|nr:hypothetical protein [Candidatus Binataceae bacterium]